MYNFKPSVIDWTMLWPVIIVMGTGILALIIEMFRPKKNNNAIVVVCLAGLVAAFVSLFAQFGLPIGETFSQMVFRDRVGLILQAIMIGACFLSILFSEGYLREKRISFGEFYPLALWSTAGAMIMVGTKSLLMIFLGLEVLSIALYVMAGMSRGEVKSEESAIKYFLLGAFASGFLLYGIAFIYGATGSLHLDAIKQAWFAQSESSPALIVFGLGLMLIGLCFKSSFVPFHQWTPDVYQGAPTNVTAFMSAVSKIAAIGALYRVLDATLPLLHVWMPALFWIAILTMSIGNLIALRQQDAKRVLAYSSIAHAGYILVALLAHFKRPEEIGLNTTLFYLLSYSVMTIGAFAVISLTANRGKEGTRFENLHGLWKNYPGAATAFVIFIASLIGIPPTVGFFGKFLIFNDALQANLPSLAIVLAVNSIISTYYYLGLIKAVFVAEDKDEIGARSRMNFGLATATVLCVAGTIGISLFATPILNWMGLS